jgi:hypothetical protein
MLWSPMSPASVHSSSSVSRHPLPSTGSRMRPVPPLHRYHWMLRIPYNLPSPLRFLRGAGTTATRLSLPRASGAHRARARVVRSHPSPLTSRRGTASTYAPPGAPPSPAPASRCSWGTPLAPCTRRPPAVPPRSSRSAPAQTRAPQKWTRRGSRSQAEDQREADPEQGTPGHGARRVARRGPGFGEDRAGARLAMTAGVA